MTELQALTAQRDEILAEIRSIEENCEGIENANNAQRVQELNLEQACLNAQKSEMQAKLSAVQERISFINTEIAKLSGTGIDRILEAIKNQRWYFFKNKKKVFFDRLTGRIWANQKYYYERPHTNDYQSLVKRISLDGFTQWNIPNSNDINQLNSGLAYLNLINDYYWVVNGYYGTIGSSFSNHSTGGNYYLLPFSTLLIDGTDYKGNVSEGNPVYTEKERLQFTLDLFVENEFWPIFVDDEITELYKKIYFEKPKLLARLQELQAQIEDLQTVTLLSSDFDYTALLAKYNVKAIDESIIKYYQAVQQWTYELMDKLDFYEKEMHAVIRDFNLIGLKLAKKYEANPHLTDEENTLLAERQHYFQKRFSLGMHSVKSKILAVKKQADALEYRIDEIDNGEDAIHQLALLEKEERASFGFIAENTAKIIKNALLKIEYFQEHHQFVMNAVDIWEKWSENYRVFKTTYREDLKAVCEDDGIEEETWSKWYEDWQSIRLAVEYKVQPIIEQGLKAFIPTIAETEVSVPELLIAALDEYKRAIDKFFLEERKGIYQKFIFQAGGELQDKFETESELYKCTASLQTALQEIIFNCSKAEDRVFILKWANSLLDIQIDEILDFVADNDLQKISQTILSEFAELKQKNYDVYLADAKAYGEEKSRREKEYNSLIFKMRKDLMK
ncbi:MAG: hypothetical protein ACI3ZR_03040 [bacterium]